MPDFSIIFETQWLFVSLCVFVSLLVGSFLNVVIYRLPVMMERENQLMLFYMEAEQKAKQENKDFDFLNIELPSELKTPFNLATPRSRCPHCDHPISASENIPILSYILQGGRCTNCKTRISKRYPFVEFCTALLSGITATLLFNNPLAAAMAILLTWALIALTGIDYDTYLLPDSITLPLVWLGLIVNYFNLFTSLENAVWGAIFGYLILWSVYWLFKLTTGKEGMGFGDFKLLAALGAWLGWEMLPLIILLSSLVGAIVGIVMIIFSKHDSQKPIPFGPYLAAAGWIALLWGEQITSSYFKFLNI